MAGKIVGLNEYVVIRSLRRFRDRYFSKTSNVKPDSDDLTPVDRSAEEDPPLGLLDSLPADVRICLTQNKDQKVEGNDATEVDVQFLIMALLSPVDICRLGATSHYWRAMVRDPLLWRYFLLRDMPHWTSIDHETMPQLEALAAPLCRGDEKLEDGMEGQNQGKEPKHDYMAEYLKGSPACRQQWLLPRPPYEAVTSFLQSLVPSIEPRFAMFGPGMEQLDVSMVTRLMHAPDVLPVAGTPQRQINGIGSGISYMYNNQQKFNILTLYSTNRAERARARAEHQSVSNKLFSSEGTDQSGYPIFTPTPQVQEVCQAVNGFIYVANAEPGRAAEGELEAAQIRAVVSPAWGSTSRPLLVLSCISKEHPDPAVTTSQGSSCTRSRARCRTPCVDMAQRLSLPQLPNPWKVQDTVAESLSGLLDGISWLLRCSGVRLYSS